MDSKRVAVITGALGGIGSATCKALVESGFFVVALSRGRTEQQINDWLDEQQIDRASVSFKFLDITDSQASAEVIKEIFSEFGSVELLVNNAGITRDGLFRKMNFDSWYQVLNTNLISLYSVTQPVFKAMCEQGHGRIINISSINGLKGQFGQVNYSAAKAGIIGFTKALALEGAGKGVTVNAIAPGYTATPMVTAIKDEVLEQITSQVPMKRLALPEEIAGAVTYLASGPAAYITGETLSLNGGQYMH
ncbi:SDR family oxidoreductase [Aliagarivorans taiwanensis]|uniref:SDR family oxidoreductase n=1 Tax=Aliagarivorans taiwanensis TaxID=561966 RepID=UPI0003FAD8A6|nr:SDR family oxidoreductase [Aliagarivorans taiwanensis]